MCSSVNLCCRCPVIRQTLLLAVLGSLNAGNPLSGDAAAPFVPVVREIVLLTDEATQTSERGETSTRIIEACLHRLGFLARHWSVREGVPPDALIDNSAGIVSLIQQNVTPDPSALIEALKQWCGPARPLILLGGLDPLLGDPTGRTVSDADANRLLTTLGLEREPVTTRSPQISWHHAHWPWFEIEQAPPDRNWRGVHPIQPTGEIVAAIAETGQAPSAVAVVTPNGAYLSELGVLLKQNPVSFRYRWRFDPYLFFSKALHCADQPIPDVSTVNGRRVFFAHVDGDGFANVAIEPRRRVAAQVLHEELLMHTTVPTTVSVIARDLVDKPVLQTLARRIFALPHIEAASHSFTHPHDWQRGIGTPSGAVADWQDALLNGRSTTLLPTREVDQSLAFVQGLLPASKRPAIFLWSGMTNPSEAFLARTVDCGVANMNGGDAVIDPDAPSVTCLAPLAERVGQHWQVFTAAGNENLFTNQWSGPYDGQLALLEQFRLTESPRRLSAANLYYHFYAAERAAGLRALKVIDTWARQTPLAYLSASDYARSVMGFISARWQRLDAGVWRLRGWGDCRTVRVDGAHSGVDLSRSEGVAGYRRAPGCLYVHLSKPDATLVLASEPPRLPHLEQASAPLSDWGVSNTRVRGVWQARGPLEVVLAGFGKNQELTVTGPGNRRVRADSEGRLTLKAGPGRVSWEVTW